MYVPSPDLGQELTSVSHGLYFEDAGAHVDVVVKLPTELIKSMTVGAKAFLTFGLRSVQGHLVMFGVLVVDDDPEVPFYLLRAVRPAEIRTVKRLLQQGEMRAFTFDELTRCVACFTGSIPESEGLAGRLEAWRLLAVDPTAAQQKGLMDIVGEELSQSSAEFRAIPLALEVEVLPVIIHADEAPNAPVHDSLRFVEPNHVDHPNEGLQLEVVLGRLLVRLFGADWVFPSPWAATSGRGDGEFIDLVAIGDGHLFFLEAKATSISTSSPQKSTHRRVLSLEKRLAKAARQLKGAYREAKREGGLHLSTVERSVTVTTDLPVHLIVVLSQVHPDLADHPTVKEMVSMGLELGTPVHLFDARGLSHWVGTCQSVHQFLHGLRRRWLISRAQGSVLFWTAAGQTSGPTIEN